MLLMEDRLGRCVILHLTAFYQPQVVHTVRCQFVDEAVLEGPADVLTGHLPLGVQQGSRELANFTGALVLTFPVEVICGRKKGVLLFS